MSSSGSSSSELYQRQPLLPNGPSSHSHMNGSAFGQNNHHHNQHHSNSNQTHATWTDDDAGVDNDDDEELELDVGSESTRILIDSNDDDGLHSPETILPSPHRLNRHSDGYGRNNGQDVESGLFSSLSTSSTSGKGGGGSGNMNGKGHHKSSSMSDYSSVRGGPQHRDATKLDLPPPTREEYKFPKDRFKTFIAGLFFVFCGTVNMISLSIVHDRVPDREKGALPDIILDNIQVNDWALYVAEYLLMVLTYFCLLICIFHKHRWILFRRCFFLLGLLYLYRSLTMFVTVLPVASRTYECKEKANSTSAALVFHRTFELLLGMGLSVNGHHKYCGDYIYSGHTMILVLGALFVKEYTPRRWLLLHWLTVVWSFVGILMILYSRGHYTIDVVLAYYITTRLFWMYHTFANNVLAKKPNNENNLLTRVWWYWFYWYLEKNVGGPVPRVYQMPIPFAKVCRWLRYRNHRP